MALLRLYSNGPNKASLTIANGFTDTGYAWSADGTDLGNAQWEHAFSGARGTQGARPSTGAPKNRPASFPIKVVKSASKDQLLQRTSALIEIVDDMRRYGGRILWQSAFQTARQWFEVMVCGWAEEVAWDQIAETNFVFTNKLNAVCAPYLSGDPMDTLDTFDVDSSTDYTANAPVSGAIAIANGVLTASSTALKAYRHTVKGYSLGDVQVTMDVTTAGTVTSGVWGVGICMDTAGADTMLVAEFVAGTNVIRVGKYIGASFTSLATAAATPAINTRYWVRGRREGNLVTAEVFTSPPTPVATPTASVTYALTASEGARFGLGHAGFRWTPASTSETISELDIEPYTYRLVSMPEQVRLGGQIPGDVPATADITVTPLGGSATPIWGSVGWLERPAIVNWCWNGDFESSTIGTSGWVATAVTGVIAAGTSVTRDTTAARVKYGLADLQIVTPATTDTGASFQIFQRFKKGRVYAAMCWASSAAGVTSSRIKLGVNGDLATGTAAALATAQKIYAVTWTPTADRDSAYVAFGVNAATGTTLNIDGLVVVEVPSIALSAAIASAGAATCTVYNTPTEIPNMLPDGTLSAPFLALIELELVRVTAVSGVTWSIDRGQEGSTAATHAQDSLVVVMPPSRPQLEGKGAYEAFGLLECEAYVPALSSVSGGALSTSADANARTGFKLTWTPATSGAQTASLVYMIDPSTLYPDDYTQGEIDVEVWIREAWFTSLTNLRVTVSAQPEGGSTAGPERFTREFGNVGKLITTAGAKVSRIHRLGILPLTIDPANPQRWRLKIALSVTGGATPTWDLDYLMLLATRSRTPWPTGKANDTASASGAVPAFVPYDVGWTTTSAMSKRLRSDGSSVVSIPGGYAYPDQGPGKPIELPDQDVDLVVKLSTLVPDDPTVNSVDESVASITTSLHAAATPRYAIARGS